MIRDTFLATCRLMHDFVGHERVRARWHDASALPEMTVGALAGHTARAALRVEDYLAADPPPDGSTVSAPQYYLTAPLSAPALDAEVRQQADEEASRGVDDLLWRIGESVARLHHRLAAEPPNRRVALRSGRPITLDDYLRTRIVELTVHLDDLATSIAVPTPALPAEAVDEAISTLVAVALGRHGDLAVLRALTRAERDEVRALRVL